MKQTAHEPIFVFAKKNVNFSKDFSVEKNDVGIIKSETSTGAIIFFVRIWRDVELNTNDFQKFDFKKSGDSFPKKICNICHKLLDTDKFAKNQNGINNRSVRRPSCSDCRKHLEGINMSQKTKAPIYALEKNNEICRQVLFREIIKAPEKLVKKLS